MNNNLVEIVFLLDRSGSMSGLEDTTIKGFNTFINKQKAYEGETKVTTVLFDDQYEMLYNCMDAKEVRLTTETYFVRGSTALLDAVGRTIDEVGKRLSETNEANRPRKVIFVITTDGLENASTRYSYEEINGKINHQEEKYQWEFIFMGANLDVKKESVKLGIKAANAVSYKASKSGVAKVYDSAVEYVAKYRV